jgi:hypothetical protein
MNQADAVQHFGAARAGEGLAHAEELLVLLYAWECQPAPCWQGALRSWGETHHLLVDPLQLRDELVAELKS